MDLPFLPERKMLEKVEKLVTNLCDKNEYVIHIRTLKQGLNHGLILNKVHRVIKFNPKDWLKPYIDINTELRLKTKNNFEKDFFKLMNNTGFGKTMENLRKHRDIKLIRTERRRNYLVSEPRYHTTNFFAENLLAIEMKKIRILMNKPVYMEINLKNKKNKTKQNKKTLANVNMIFIGRNDAIKFINDFDSMILEAKRKAAEKPTKVKGLKILTPKQMFQRIPITLAQVNAGNTSKNALNKIRQIIYSLYRAKEITKKVYNNIMNSIKV